MDELKTKAKVVGLKQSRKAVKDGAAAIAFIAGDADMKVRQPFESLCAEAGVKVEYAESCAELGKACGIEVGCAVAAILLSR